MLQDSFMRCSLLKSERRSRCVRTHFRPSARSNKEETSLSPQTIQRHIIDESYHYILILRHSLLYLTHYDLFSRYLSSAEFSTAKLRVSLTPRSDLFHILCEYIRLHAVCETSTNLPERGTGLKARNPIIIRARKIVYHPART